MHFLPPLATRKIGRVAATYFPTHLIYVNITLCLRETSAFWACLIFSRFHLVQDLSLFVLVGHLSQIPQFWTVLFAIFLTFSILQRLFDAVSDNKRSVMLNNKNIIFQKHFTANFKHNLNVFSVIDVWYDSKYNSEYRKWNHINKAKWFDNITNMEGKKFRM